MGRGIRDADYRALAELRYQIRCFLNSADQAAREAGLEPQQYQLLLALRGLPEGRAATIRTLAERLLLQHHSTVELVDRLAAHGYVRRTRGSKDHRQVIVRLLPRGKRLLERVARERLGELRSGGQGLVGALRGVLADRRAEKRRPTTRPDRKQDL
jgi:DNA-binding MarR family transcriptional regulator